MFSSLFSLVMLGLIYYFLWSLWCRYAPNLLAPDAPRWVKRPSFFLFIFVMLFVLFLYRNIVRR